MTVLLIIQIVILLLVLAELILLRINRIAFEELIVKWVEVCQTLYDTGTGNNKKLSDNVGNLSKALQSSLSIKNDIKALEGSVKDLQGTTKVIRTETLKEFKDIEDSIKKLKILLKQEK